MSWVILPKKYIAGVIGGAIFSIVFIFFGYSADAAGLVRPANNLGLLAYWGFEDASSTKVTDSSGNGNTGTINGNPTWTNGRRGKALTFDGRGDYVLVSNSNLLGLSVITACAWVKAPLSITFPNIFSVSDGTDGWDFYLNASYGDGQNFQTGTSFGISGNFIFKEDGTFITPNQWAFVCVTQNGDSASNIKTYVNAVENSGSGTGSGTRLSDSGNSIRIGDSAAGGYPFTGTIDELRIYNRVLTQAEITSLYNSGVAKLGVPSTRGLIGYWAMEDASGTKATDSSGNGKVATLSNSPTWVSGKRGGALYFSNGTNRVAASSSLDNAPAVTYAAWVKVDSATTGNQRIIINKTTEATGARYILVNNDGTVEGRVRSNTGPGARVVTNATINDDRWHHVVLTYDDNGDRKPYIYIDGAIVSYSLQNTGVNSLGDDAGDWYIGNNFANTRPLAGAIDEVRFYNRVLSQAEITTLYTAGAAKVNATAAGRGPQSGLVGHWTFDGAHLTTTTSTDVSGQARHGTLTGASGTQNKPQPTIGKAGQALNFDGTDDTVSVPSLASSTSYTLAAWINPVGSGDAFQNIITDSGGADGLLYRTTGAIYTSNNGTGTQFGSIASGSWAHVAVSVDNGSGTVYINGAQNGSPSSMRAFNVGNIGGVSGGYVRGGLDDVRVYNRALSAGEVLELYNIGK